MVGELEYIHNPNGDEQVAMIERGSKEAVLVTPCQRRQVFGF